MQVPKNIKKLSAKFHRVFVFSLSVLAVLNGVTLGATTLDAKCLTLPCQQEGESSDGSYSGTIPQLMFCDFLQIVAGTASVYNRSRFFVSDDSST
jgi:hypothetical protein